MMFIYCQVLLGDQKEEYAMDRACGIYRGEGKGIQGGRRNMKKKDWFEDQGIDGTIRLKCILQEWGGVYWFHLSVGRDKWWVVVGIILNLQAS
jgi:hypothetical protein